MMTTSDPMKSRETDPETSDAGVKQVEGLQQKVLMSATTLSWGFTDSDLKRQVKHDYFIDVDRGVIARTRLRLERDGKLVRLPLGDGDKETTFATSLGTHMTSKGSRI